MNKPLFPDDPLARPACHPDLQPLLDEIKDALEEDGIWAANRIAGEVFASFATTIEVMIDEDEEFTEDGLTLDTLVQFALHIAAVLEHLCGQVETKH